MMDMEKAHAGGGFAIPGLRTRASGISTTPNRLRKFIGGPGNAVRNHVVAMGGEFLGTFLFLFFAFTGTQVANSQTQSSTSTTIAQGSNPAQLLYISLSFGFSLAVNAWVFFRISGGLFNPAVTFGMCLVGAVPWLRGGLIFISQLFGAVAASALVSTLYPGQLNVRTTLGAGTSHTQGLFIEMFLTAMLVFTIFMLAAEKHKGTFIAPIGIGLALFIAELGGVYYTGGSLNPARSFGPCAVVHTFESYHWVYWIGPLLGSILASAFYRLFKLFEYETANPGQDFDENETKFFNPETDVDRPIVSLASASDPIDNQGRPISGGDDTTLGGTRRDSVPLDKTSANTTPRLPQSAMKGGRRGSSPLPPLGAEVEQFTNRGTTGVSDDVVHGGPHQSHTANVLDPHIDTVRPVVPVGESYQAGPDAEAGQRGSPP